MLIYCLKDPDTKEIRYIGKTIQPLKNRYASHISVSKHNKKKDYTHCWIKKLLNENKLPLIEIIKEKALLEDEIFYIDFYRKIGCNLTNHAIGGALGNTGCRWKITGSQLERYKYLRAIKIDQYDLDGNFLKTWDSCAELSRYLNLNKNSVNNSLNRNGIVKNYKIVKYGEKFSLPKKMLHNPVIVVNLITKEIFEFKNSTEVGKFLNIDNSTISKAIKNKKILKSKFKMSPKYAN